MLKHYKGDGALYSYNRYKDDPNRKEEHKNGIFFDTTNRKIYLNGDVYGGGDSSELKTTNPIRISGGPLAAEFEKNCDDSESPGLDGNFQKNEGDSYYTIPAGTSILDLLTKLFEYETWPGITENDPELSAAFTAATFTGISDKDIMDVGSTVTIKLIETGAIDDSPRGAGVGTFTFGSSKTTNKEDIDTEATAFGGPLIDGSVSLEKGTEENPINHSFTFELNFGDCSITNDTINNTKVKNKVFTHTMSNIDSDSWQYVDTINDQLSFTVEQYANTIYYSLKTDSKLLASFLGIDSYYVVSSLGNLDASKVSKVVPPQTLTCDINDIINQPITVTGAYPIYTTGKLLYIGADAADSSYDSDNKQDGKELWIVDSTEYKSLNAITLANKNLVPVKQNPHGETNYTADDAAFYMYIGFGSEQNAEGDTLVGNKLVLLPQGWYVDRLELENDVYKSGPAVYNPMVLTGDKFVAGIDVFRINTTNFDLCAPLKQMKANGRISTIAGVTDEFLVKHPTNNNTHNYTAWCFTNLGSADVIKMRVSKRVNNYSSDTLTKQK